MSIQSIGSQSLGISFQSDSSSASSSISSGSDFPNPLEGFSAARTEGSQRIAQGDRGDIARNTQEGFFAKVGRWFSEGQKALNGTYGLPERTVISAGGKAIGYSREELASMIKSLPRLERAAARENLAETLSARVERGHSLVKDVLSGQITGTGESQCTEQDAADIMLFLDAKNRTSTDTSFDSGSYNIQDPEGKLYEFLDRSDDKYLRSSSHMSTMQQSTITDSNGGTHKNMHRGIDFKQGPTTGLPSGLQTLLFAAIPANSETGTDRRIFLKPESYGCRSPFKSTPTSSPGVGDGVGTLSRGRRAKDIMQFLGHSGSFIFTRFSGAGGTTRKERIPTQVAADFKALAKKPAFSQVRDLLNAGAPTSNSNGIHKMVTNITNAIQALPLNQRGAAIRETFEFMDTLGEHLHSANNLDTRIGNEVVLNVDELQGLGYEDAGIIDTPGVEIRNAFTRLTPEESVVLGRTPETSRPAISLLKSGMVDFLQTVLDSSSTPPIAGSQAKLESLYNELGLEDRDRNLPMLLGNVLGTAFTGLPESIDNIENRNTLLNIAKLSFSADQLEIINRATR